MTTPVSTGSEPIHTWMGLSYSNYLVLQRTLLQSMPAGWQQRFVACLEELFTAYPEGGDVEFEVRPCQWVCPGDLSQQELDAQGITIEYDGDPEDPATRWVYLDRDGNELDPHITCVARPTRDPVPHYNRGRTYLPPRASGEPS